MTMISQYITLPYNNRLLQALFRGANLSLDLEPHGQEVY